MKRSAPIKRTAFKRKTAKPRKANPLKPSTRSRVSKKPWKCEAYRNHVKSRPCLICGVWGVDAHHIRERFDRTMGRQISDVWLVPLCRAHHTYLHKHSRTFWQDCGVFPEIWCEASFQRWRGVLSDCGTARHP